MASIEKRGKFWCVRYVVKDAYGNIVGQKRKSGFATKADAMAAARDLEQATARGVDVHGDQMTCGELLERWFASKLGTIEQSSLETYSYRIDRLKATPIYNVRICALQSDSMNTLISELTATGISTRTALNYSSVLRMSLKWAVQKGYILKPFDDEPLQRSKKRDQVIVTEEDIEDLIRVCRITAPYFLTPLYLALYGGLRREECAGLRWDCVQDNSVMIRTARTVTPLRNVVEKDPKSKSSRRTVTLPKFVMEYLRSLPHVSEYVCTGKQGGPLALLRYSVILKGIVEKVNEERTKARKAPMPRPSFHDLRHTHAAMCIALGIQPKVISERLGHASISITMDTYGYLMPGMQEQVAAMLDEKFA